MAQQPVRQLVGLRIQRCIRQPLTLILHRHRFRCPLDLLLEQLMNQCILRIGSRRPVELMEHLHPLFIRQDRQCQQLPIRFMLQHTDHLIHGEKQIMGNPVRAFLRLSQYLHPDRKACTQIVHRQGQGIVRAFLDGNHGYPGLCLQVWGNVRGTVPVIENRAEEGQVARNTTATLRHGKRGLLVRQQPGQRLPC